MSKNKSVIYVNELFRYSDMLAPFEFVLCLLDCNEWIG